MDTAASNMLSSSARLSHDKTNWRILYSISLTLLCTIVRRLCSFNVKDPNDSTPSLLRKDTGTFLLVSKIAKAKPAQPISA